MFRIGTWKKTLTTLSLHVVAVCLATAQPTAPSTGASVPEKTVPGIAPTNLPAAPTTEVVHTAAEVRQLGTVPAGLGRSVNLQGVVTFVHAEQRMFYLSDSTGGVAVALADTSLLLPKVSEAVAVTGTVAAGAIFPSVRASVIKTAGRVDPPLAQNITFAQGISGAMDAQWVEIRGQLRQIEVLSGWQRLTLGTPTAEFSVSIPTAERPPAAVGAMLRVRGVCAVWATPKTRQIGGFFLFTPSLADVQVLDAGEAGATTLTLVNQVQRLRADEAKSGWNVHLRGVVTFAHPDQRSFYLSDATGGVLVWLGNSEVSLPAVGTVVSVRGRTGVGVISASVYADELGTAGVRALPPPHAISLEQALTGSEDGQWVEMRGQLRQVEAIGHWVRLTLTAAVGDFAVSIPTDSTVEAKVGSFLRVRGVCQPWLDKKNQIGGIFLYTPSLSQIEVTERPLDDPFAVPEEAIGNLPLYRTPTLQQQQVLIRGIVLHHVPGRFVMVESGSGVVRALSRSDSPLQPGDHVDVAGVPGRQGNRVVLRGAVYRRTGTGPAPSPIDLGPDAKAEPALDGRLVTVSGSIVNLLWRPEYTRLLVQRGNSVLELGYQGAISGGVAAEWTAGSKVVATGLYEVEYDEADQPLRFSLQLRSPADLAILERPSWWTIRRALIGLGVIGGMLVLGLAWLVALRRRLRHQTKVIRAQLEKEANLQARHGEIIANASDFIFTTDLEGKFNSYNPAGERLTGYGQAEAFKLGLPDLIAQEDAATGAALLALARRSEPTRAERFEMRFRTRDGRLVWMETIARPTREAGQPTGLLGVARDVTERKQAEAEKGKLEDLNRQLQKSESLSRMAGAIAHHFNNQLHAVMMSLEIAIDDKSSKAESADALAVAMRAARKAAEVSTLMLTYLGQSHAEREPLDLSEACRQNLAQLRAVMPPNVVWESKLPTPGPRLNANASQIRQALTNLVTNAKEANGNARAVIRVTVTTVSALLIPVTNRFPLDGHLLDKNYACLEVMDGGCGIPEQDIEKIFDPFFSSKLPGRGMGLAAVLGIVRAHDGVITVTSELGHGSIFRIFLPIATAPVSPSTE